MLERPVVIAICFNEEKQARELALKLQDLSTSIEFVINPNFDSFLKEISKKRRIDCFILEEDFSECPAYDLAEKLRTSQKYKKSVISLACKNRLKIDPRFRAMGVQSIFDPSANFLDVKNNLRTLLEKKLEPIIPKDFRVLVVDNRAEMLELISMHMGEIEHSSYDLCQSVRDAKNLMNEHLYDLLLLDWNLDDGTCIDLIEFMKNGSLKNSTKNALVMVITGRDAVDDIMTLLRYGVKDHIIKPFDFHEFEEKISYAIEKHLKSKDKHNLKDN